jgi:hypothetical protein
MRQGGDASQIPHHGPCSVLGALERWVLTW